MTKVGSLFSGVAGLDMAVAEVFPNVEPAWFCEIEEAPSKVLAHHFPGVPNFGDVTKVDEAVIAKEAPVSVLTGGFP